MQGLIRALARLLVMGLVMAAVQVAAIVAGIATTTAIAVGIVLAGVAGLVMVARRPRGPSAADEIAAMMKPAEVAPPPSLSPTKATAVEAMAPTDRKEVDPEASMPRWRRPSLIAARHSDPTREAPVYRLPMRFADDLGSLDIRVVRYAVVPVLDRPDEVLGLRLSDLEAGDEVLVLNATGAFLQVECPNADKGWIHRTTVGQRAPSPAPAFSQPAASRDADDALTALLSARGLI